MGEELKFESNSESLKPGFIASLDRRFAVWALILAGVNMGFFMVLTFMAPILTEEIQRIILAIGLGFFIFGITKVLTDIRYLKTQLTNKVKKLEGVIAERDDYERLLTAATSSRLGAGLQTDIAQVLNGLVEGVGAEMGACYFFDSKTGVLTPQKAVGTVALGFLKATGLALVENDPLASVVINGNTILENSVGDQSKRGLQHRILPRNYVANSLLIVPMKIDSEVLGLFLLASQESNKFSQNDLSLALATATGTAAAMISARLLDTSQQQVRQAAIVKDLALAINSSLEVNQIAKLFLIKARALVSYDLAALILFDGDVYKVQVLVNDDGELVVKEETEGRLSGSLYEKIKNGKILARRALGENDEYSTQKPLEIRLGNQFSEVLIPLKVKDQIAGCIAFRSPQSMAYPEKNNEDLYELASLGGMAISNAILYSSTLSQTSQFI